MLFILRLMCLFFPVFPFLEVNAATQVEVHFKIDRVKGHVEVLRRTHTLEVKPAMAIMSDDRIHTGADGHVRIVSPIGKYDIAPNTVIRVGEISQGPKVESLSLIYGHIRGVVKKIEGQKQKPIRFRLQTPTTTMGVRGTEFLAHVERSEEDFKKCLDGKELKEPLSEDEVKKRATTGELFSVICCIEGALELILPGNKTIPIAQGEITRFKGLPDGVIPVYTGVDNIKKTRAALGFPED